MAFNVDDGIIDEEPYFDDVCEVDPFDIIVDEYGGNDIVPVG